MQTNCQVKTDLFWKGSSLNRRHLVPRFFRKYISKMRWRRLLLLLPPLSPKGELLQKEQFNYLSEVTLEVCGSTGNCQASPGCPRSTLSTNSALFSAWGPKARAGSLTAEAACQHGHWAVSRETLTVCSEGRAAIFISELMEADTYCFLMIYVNLDQSQLEEPDPSAASPEDMRLCSKAGGATPAPPYQLHWVTPHRRKIFPRKRSLDFFPLSVKCI